MGYSGARALGAASRGIFGIGDALMQIGARQDDDERVAREQAYRASRDATEDRQYNDSRRLQLESLGYAIMDPSSDPLARAVGNADRATGTPTRGYLVGKRDPMQSFAVQDAKAAERARYDAGLEIAEDAIRRVHSGDPRTTSDYGLPPEIRESFTAEGRALGLTILQRFGDTPDARDEIAKLPGLKGRAAANAFHDAIGDRAVADLTRDDDDHAPSLVQTDAGFAWADPDDRSITPVPGARPRPTGAGANQGDKLAELRALATNPSPAGDVALIMAFNKIMDPQSTVREGEFQTIQEAQGLGGRLKGTWNRLTRGERLTPEQRQDLLSRAEAVLGARAGQPVDDIDAKIREVDAAHPEWTDEQVAAEVQRIMGGA